MGKRAPRTKDEPDAFVYVDETGGVVYLCRHCVKLIPTTMPNVGQAFVNAQLHLWAQHSRRYVWIDRSDPAHTRAVQQALPIVLAHNTTRHG